jgi:hypothetical protein
VSQSTLFSFQYSNERGRVVTMIVNLFVIVMENCLLLDLVFSY